MQKTKVLICCINDNVIWASIHRMTLTSL